MQSEDEVKKDINEIKSEILTLKTEFYNLIDILTNKIPEVTQLRGKTLIEKFQDIQREKAVLSVLNHSIIRDTEIKKLAYYYDKNICNCKDKQKFYYFCYYVAGLVEEITKVFLKRKFFELQKEQSIDLLEAYSLVKSNFKPSPKLRFPDIYINQEEFSRLQKQYNYKDDNYYHDGDKYLSLIELEGAYSWFLLDMCCAILWKEKFYKDKDKFVYKDYITNTRRSKQTFPAAIKRQPLNSNNYKLFLNIEYYFRLCNTRTIRNKYEHNKINKSNFKREIENLADYVKVDVDNYDGILEAANWLLIQLDSPQCEKM